MTPSMQISRCHEPISSAKTFARCLVASELQGTDLVSGPVYTVRAFKHQKLKKEKPLKLKVNELLKKVSVQSGNYQNVNWLISQNLFIDLAVIRKQTPVPFLKTKTCYKMFQDMASKQHKCTMIYIDQPPLPSLTSLIHMRFIDWSNYSYLVKNF